MATDKPRYSISMEEELFNEIEAFRFENRFQTRSAATVELIKIGLQALKKEKSSPKTEQELLYEKLDAVEASKNATQEVAQREA